MSYVLKVKIICNYKHKTTSAVPIRPMFVSRDSPIRPSCGGHSCPRLKEFMTNQVTTFEKLSSVTLKRSTCTWYRMASLPHLPCFQWCWWSHSFQVQGSRTTSGGVLLWWGLVKRNRPWRLISDFCIQQMRSWYWLNFWSKVFQSLVSTDRIRVVECTTRKSAKKTYCASTVSMSSADGHMNEFLSPRWHMKLTVALRSVSSDRTSPR